MIHSMTGFGRASFRVGDTTFEIEVRSVNQRHLDARVRVPRALASLEHELRARIQERFLRGKLDCTVSAPGGENLAPRLEVDREAARAYLKIARALEAEEGVSSTMGSAELLALPGVARLIEPEWPGEELRQAVMPALDGALAGLAAMRAAEGEALARELDGRLGRIGELTDGVAGRSGEVQQAVRERLRKRARQLEAEVGGIDESRLHQEIALAADRLDITEECVRMRSHVEQFRKVLSAAGPGQPAGRRLDFLLQEMAREANTLGAKCADADSAHLVVELKTELERMREQVQNVE
jgi:uncharacterized protein (TIGR00255 family)